MNYLRESKEKYDGSVLIPVFTEGNKQLRWEICDAITYNPPLNINNWVKEVYLDANYDDDETGLSAIAVIKMFPKDQARNILRQVFDHHPGMTALALGKAGNLEDILFLEEKLKLRFECKFIYKEIEKAISKIRKINKKS